MENAKIVKKGNETYLSVPKLEKEFRFNNYSRHKVKLKFNKSVEELNQKQINELAKEKC